MKVISLGWGVQSWTLAAMAALGEIEADIAIHADTGWEKAATYAFREQWEPWLQAHGLLAISVADYQQSAKVTTLATDIPAFTVSATGNAGILRRQCTGRWKIDPIRRALKQVLWMCDIKKRAGCIESLQGISLDEWQRMKNSDVKWIVNRYPLVEKRMTRGDCETWLAAHDLPTPPKSACVFCPFQSERAWGELKRHNADDWQTAISVDEKIRDVRAPYRAFVHSKMISLVNAVSIPEDIGMIQADFLDNAGCDSGYCFV